MSVNNDYIRITASQLKALNAFEQGRDAWYRHLERGDYVVCVNLSGVFPTNNFVYKVDEFISDGTIVLNCTVFSSDYFRPANAQEIALYEQYGRPIDINTHPTSDSLKKLSSQSVALVLYEQGDQDWYKQLEYGDYVMYKREGFSGFKDHAYKIDGLHSGSIIVDHCIYPPEYFRPATDSEIAAYNAYGGKSDTSTHPTKDNASTGLSGGLNEEGELSTEAKRRYPKGTKFRSALDNTYIGTSMGNFRVVVDSVHCEVEKGEWLVVKFEGKWAEVIAEAKKSEDETENEHYERLVRLHSPTFNDWSPYYKMKMKEAEEELSRMPMPGITDGWAYCLMKMKQGQDIYIGDLSDSDNSIHTVSSRPSVIPFKEDKHIEINILKRNINI